MEFPLPATILRKCPSSFQAVDIAQAACSSQLSQSDPAAAANGTGTPLNSEQLALQAVARRNAAKKAKKRCAAHGGLPSSAATTPAGVIGGGERLTMTLRKKAGLYEVAHQNAPDSSLDRSYPSPQDSVLMPHPSIMAAANIIPKKERLNGIVTRLHTAHEGQLPELSIAAPPHPAPTASASSLMVEPPSPAPSSPASLASPISRDEEISSNRLKPDVATTTPRSESSAAHPAQSGNAGKRLHKGLQFPTPDNTSLASHDGNGLEMFKNDEVVGGSGAVGRRRKIGRRLIPMTSSTSPEASPISRRKPGIIRSIVKRSRDDDSSLTRSTPSICDEEMTEMTLSATSSDTEDKRPSPKKRLGARRPTAPTKRQAKTAESDSVIDQPSLERPLTKREKYQLRLKKNRERYAKASPDVKTAKIRRDGERRKIRYNTDPDARDRMKKQSMKQYYKLSSEERSAKRRAAYHALPPEKKALRIKQGTESKMRYREKKKEMEMEEQMEVDEGPRTSRTKATSTGRATRARTTKQNSEARNSTPRKSQPIPTTDEVMRKELEEQKKMVANLMAKVATLSCQLQQNNKCAFIFFYIWPVQKCICLSFRNDLSTSEKVSETRDRENSTCLSLN
ncbi:hypothetical protein PMAYCL1PPCAC_26401 [Pristionchus mayeri]|uniref:Uncharacterized protein n=1 Tax=Pristionchus mayeri TaxID=1317129 RepID=A0AAN5IAT3_9BILA|nr:hypothetical protein PMAYCL1PPCAC_26401 [Pristionchus mayeri]